MQVYVNATFDLMSTEPREQRDVSPGTMLAFVDSILHLTLKTFQVAIHSPMDQPIMALSDIDLSPGFVTQLSVTPILRGTTPDARWRFTPVERGCYFDEELEFKYLPKQLYR